MIIHSNPAKPEHNLPKQDAPDPRMGDHKYALNYPHAWIWCLHCERVFQAKDLRDFMPHEGMTKDLCAFDDCDGAGFHVDLYLYPEFHQPREGLPQVADLHKGMEIPQYDPELVKQQDAAWKARDRAKKAAKSAVAIAGASARKKARKSARAARRVTKAQR
jgi:hypothetical protein